VIILDSKIKDFIKEHKLSDTDIYKALQALNPAEKPDAEITEEASSEVEELVEVETVVTTELPSVNTPAQTGEKSDGFSLEKLNELIDQKVAEKLKTMPKDQPQTGMPFFDNPKREKQWKRL